MIGKLASSSLAGGKNNVAFLSFFIRGDLEQCLDLLISTSRLPEAAFFARSYLPSKLPQVCCILGWTLNLFGYLQAFYVWSSNKRLFLDCMNLSPRQESKSRNLEAAF